MISNPTIETTMAASSSSQDSGGISSVPAEKTDKIGQLDVVIETLANKSTSINILFTDFRIILAFPTIKALMLFAASALLAFAPIQKKLIESENMSAKSISVVSAKAAPPTDQTTQVHALLQNIQVFVPENALYANTKLMKFSLSTEIRLSIAKNKMELNGNLNNMCLVLERDDKKVSMESASTQPVGKEAVVAPPRIAESLLTKFSVDFSINQLTEPIPGEASLKTTLTISTNIEPIEITLSLTQIKLFRSFGDSLMTEVAKLPIDVIAKSVGELKGSTEVKPVEVEATAVVPSIKDIYITPTLKEFKFALIDDLIKYPYPVLSLSAMLIQANISLHSSPMHESQVITGSIFEISLHLCQMLHCDKEKYQSFYLKTHPPQKPVLKACLNGLTFKVMKDNNNNIDLNFTMWRFHVEDQQIKVISDNNSKVVKEEQEQKQYKITPLVCPEFQHLISNPDIEQAISEIKIDPLMPVEARRKLVEEKMLQKKLSQMNISVIIKSDLTIDINFKMSEFRIIFAAQTISALAKTLKHITYITSTMIPKVIVKMAGDKASEKLSAAVKYASEKTEAALNKGDSSIKINGEMENLRLLLPEKGINKDERIAEFKLSSSLKFEMKTKEKANSEMKINAGVNSITLSLINPGTNVPLETIIRQTKIGIDLMNIGKEKSQNMGINIAIDPIIVNVGFRHLEFFASTLSEMLPKINLIQAAVSQEKKSIGSLQVMPEEKKRAMVPATKPASVMILSIAVELPQIAFQLFDDYRFTKMREQTRFEYPLIKIELSKFKTKLEQTTEGKGRMNIIASVSALSCTLSKGIAEDWLLFTNDFYISHEDKTGNICAHMEILYYYLFVSM